MTSVRADMPFRAVAGWLFLVWVLMSPSLVQAQVEGLSYTVAFHGLDANPSLLAELQSLSTAIKRQEQPHLNGVALKALAKGDGEAFVQALKAKGWFDARVEPEISGEAEQTVITFIISCGERYRLGPATVQLANESSLFVVPSMAALGLQEGLFAQSALIFAAGEKLVTLARQQGFPQARLLDRPMELDRHGHRLLAVLAVDTGPLVRLGQVTFLGSEGIEGDFLARHLSWRPGAIYHPKRFDRIYRSLMGTGLFSAVKVELGSPPEKGDLWPVTVRLTQRRHRSIAVGGGYSTDKGPNLKASWEHRNVLGVGQRLSSKTELGTDAQLISLSHETPDFLMAEQKLTFSLLLDRSLADAFDSQSIQLGATLLRPVFAPGGEGSLGVEWRIADVHDNSTDIRSSFASSAIPLTLKLDRSDDLLDPGQGWRSRSEIKPVLALSKSGQSHIVVSQRGSTYQKLMADPRLVLALRVEADTVQGASHDSLAADQRLYAGGSATLRGVGSQLAGPLDGQNKPTGGRSLLALGSEIRLLLRQTWELVAFVDGAMSYDKPIPDLSQGMLFGTGIGGRYLTPIGPLRLDVGVPLRRRTGIDDPFQIYISIGQAF
ncbi:MAG: BamA/TamA family outer membrane protein [Magnetococcales bacterium]|nr:BamA/TamA family outer membrane protein [Magnetococcales bacterium]